MAASEPAGRSLSARSGNAAIGTAGLAPVPVGGRIDAALESAAVSSLDSGVSRTLAIAGQDRRQHLGHVEHELEHAQAAEEDEQRADAVAQEEHQRVDGVLDAGAHDAHDAEHGDEARADDAEDGLEHGVDRDRDDSDHARGEPSGQRERVEHDREHRGAQQQHVAQAELEHVDDRELDVPDPEQERGERAGQERHEQDQPVDDVRDPADEVEVGVHRSRRRRPCAAAAGPPDARGPEHGRDLAQDLAQRPELDHDARPVARRLLPASSLATSSPSRLTIRSMLSTIRRICTNRYGKRTPLSRPADEPAEEARRGSGPRRRSPPRACRRCPARRSGR